MRYKSFYIKNFKGIKELTIDLDKKTFVKYHYTCRVKRKRKDYNFRSYKSPEL